MRSISSYGLYIFILTSKEIDIATFKVSPQEYLKLTRPTFILVLKMKMYSLRQDRKTSYEVDCGKSKDNLAVLAHFQYHRNTTLLDYLSLQENT